jgi:hypothetical protein
MKNIIFVLSLMLTNQAFSQQIFEEKQYNCNYEGMSLENSKMVVSYQSQDSMYYDLIKNVDKKFLDKVQGEIMIQMLVDSEGKPCCVSVQNETNVSSNKLKIVENVNTMMGWQKPTSGYNKVCVIISLLYSPDKIIVKRLGVGENRNFKTLCVYEILR